ncbi:hypothetical protein POM88_037864 [Heracleum sosnowskyi]|uniref:PGG domain-containing protein n=1 Tax=Heracleum sosnowskyi TaxID=360622 RepID=A0AAD8HSQ3_9APIA|nr:hypothetical protein POM88_037864 [Heracleum sosnowskyi]
MHLGQARLQPGTSLVKVVQVQFNGFVACTPSGTRILGAPGVLVSVSCQGARGTLGTAVTNSSGFYSGLISFEDGIFYDPSRGVPCFVTLKLPVTGTSCQLMPSRGTLRAPVQLLSLAGGQIAIVNAKPFRGKTVPPISSTREKSSTLGKKDGFTMPGGYRNSEPDEGMASLFKKLAFQVFVICDTIALYSAIMVAVTLIWAHTSNGHEELCAFIAHHFNNLIACKNHKGNSALQLAAGRGHLGVVEIILTFRKQVWIMTLTGGDSLVLTDEERMALDKRRLEERVAVNDEGNAALHEALLNSHKTIAEYLIKWDVEAAHHVNKQGKPPLRISVKAGNIEYVNEILNKRSKYMHLLDKELTKGRSI